MAKSKSETYTLQSKLEKFRRALKKWDNTDEGRTLYDILKDNMEVIDKSWHLIISEKDLNVLRANKMALDMLMNCFSKIKAEVDTAQKQLTDLEEEVGETPTDDIY